jgi:hypothetical protein
MSSPRQGDDIGAVQVEDVAALATATLMVQMRRGACCRVVRLAMARLSMLPLPLPQAHRLLELWLASATTLVGCRFPVAVVEVLPTHPR